MRDKFKLKNVLIWLMVGIIVSLLSHFIIELLYYNYNFEHVMDLIFNVRTELFLLGSAILFLIYSLFSSIFGSTVMGSLSLIALSWALGIATKYKSVFRSEPLYPNELYMAKELPFLMNMIGTKRTIMIAFVIVVALISLILFYKYIVKPRRSARPTKKQYILRGIGLVASLALLIYIGRFNYPDNKVKAAYNDYASWVTYNQSKNYSDNGFVAGFLSNLKAPPMETPENYSESSVAALYEKYEMLAADINKERTNNTSDTNVLFVMNESFSDPFNLEGLESDQDPIPYYREIKEESISGDVLAPSIGGGTATNEFQVLTSLSMEPFAPQMTSPYIQLTNLMTDFPAVTNKLKQYGYKTTAIHPYTPTFYKRNDVYENLNFDEFLHQGNVEYREKVSEKHRYISDASAYEEIFRVLSESEAPDFVHLVTIQNHMPYANKYDTVDFEVTGSGDDAEASAYFQDLKNSDIALESLIDKIDEYSEPVVMVFWGDHLPGFYQGDILDKNDNQTMREAPFLVYSNEVELEEEVGLISPIYLDNYVSEVLDTKVNPYEALLLKLEEQLPVFAEGLYHDQESQEVVTSRDDLDPETLETLKDYSLIMYDITTGSQYADELGFFEMSE